jgi:hypothetical protein
VNEVQIIQNQLATERLHFTEVSNICAQVLEGGKWTPGSDFARACTDYFAFAAARVLEATAASPQVRTPPEPGASGERWRSYLHLFSESAAKHFAGIEQLLTLNLPVTEWRTRAGIDADAIFTERARYARVKATVP